MFEAHRQGRNLSHKLFKTPTASFSGFAVGVSKNLMIQIISDSPVDSTGTDSLWEKPLDVSTQLVSLKRIQSLPQELKDAALYDCAR